MGLGERVAIANPLSYCNPDDAEKLNSATSITGFKPWLFHHH